MKKFSSPAWMMAAFIAGIVFVYSCGGGDGGGGSANGAPSDTEFAALVARVTSLELYHPGEVIFVPADPTDSSASGQALLNAIAGISDASEAKPYLVKLGPGVFDLGTSSLTMKEFVDLEGSGAGVINLTAAGLLPFGGSRIIGSSTSAVVVGAKHTELRDLSVVTTNGTALSYTGVLPAFGSLGQVARILRVNVMAAGGNTAIGILNDGSSILIKDVLIRVAGATSNTGIYIKNGSMPVIRNVSINSSGTDPAAAYGIFNESTNSSGFRVIDSEITVSSLSSSVATGVGISSDGSGIVQVDRSSITGNLWGVDINAGVGYLAHSQINTLSGTGQCAFLITASYAPVGAAGDCP